MQFIILITLFSVGVLSAPGDTCALKYPCPPPTWTVTYQLNLSTICQPAVSGYYLPPPQKNWGLISLDWSNAESIWLNTDRNKSTCEETNTENAKMIKQQSPGSRVFIYHNMELALQWLESQRAVMYDPTKSHWFLQFTDGNGVKNGTIYNEPRGEGDQFFWDFRVKEASDYFVSSIVKTTMNPYVDGSFTDDVEGLPEEHEDAIKAMRLSTAEVADIKQSTHDTNQNLITALISVNKYNWQAFSQGDDVGPAPSSTTCTAFMRTYCDPAMQKNPMTMQMSTTDQEQVLAAFLIVRPPYGWLGFGWESDNRNWLPIFNTDVGEPMGLCSESSTGVFTRTWSKGTVKLDCNTWVATLPF